jgi:hypothetical protein
VTAPIPAPGGRGLPRWRRIALAAGVLAALAAVPAGAADPVRSLLEMRHDRVVIQQFDLSCGAAALTTILRYQHGDMITERDVALGLIGQDIYLENPLLVRARHGFSLGDLKRFVEARGYKATGLGRLEIDDLVERAPMIVPIASYGYNHFVVFRGRYGNRVLLADPAFGNRTMTVDRFQRAWLDYGTFGKVGFLVERPGAKQGPGRLAPRPEDFVTLR